MAPEVFKQEEYDTKVDVFSFALILQEVMIYNIIDESYTVCNWAICQYEKQFVI